MTRTTSETNAAPATNRRVMALLVLVLGAMAIAFAPIFVRIAKAEGIGPVSVVAWRLGLSIPFALGWWWRVALRGRNPEQPRTYGWLVASGALLAIDLALWHVSIQFTTVASSTFILNLAPIFVTLGARFFLGESFGKGFVLALVAAVAGAALLVNASLAVSHQALVGDLIALTAAVFYAGYQLAVKHCRKAHHTADILLVTALVTPLVLAPVIALMGETVLPHTLRGWGAVIGIALVCQVLGQGLITWAVGHVRANFASVVLLVQPVTAAWLASLLFDEQLSVRQIIGCALVLAGIFLARRNSR